MGVVAVVEFGVGVVVEQVEVAVVQWQVSTCGNGDIDAFDLDGDGDLDGVNLEELACAAWNSSGHMHARAQWKTSSAGRDSSHHSRRRSFVP